MSIAATVQVMKPRLRGWLHAGAVPAALIAGVILVVVAPVDLRLATAVYAAGAVALFAVSGTYHRGNWGPKTTAVLKRLDHATIFVFIAATYTPLVVTLLDGSTKVAFLWAIWSAAILGVAFRVLWVGAPRWLTVPIYIAVGCAALLVTPSLWSNGGALIFTLVALGGLCYVVGGVIYGLRRPDPSPKWFGFHEIFHSFTLGGYVSHYIGICLAVLGVGALAH